MRSEWVADGRSYKWVVKGEAERSLPTQAPHGWAAVLFCTNACRQDAYRKRKAMGGKP